MLKLCDHYISSVCTAFNPPGLGARVGSSVRVAPREFFTALQPLVAAADLSRGVAFVQCPPEMFPLVTSGDGQIPTPQKPEHFVLVEWRGEVDKFLQRRYALPVRSLHVLVYTVAAYCADPDQDQVDLLTGELTWDARNQREEILQLRTAKAADDALIVVGVFASGIGGRPPLARRALLHNLAGGNADYLPATRATDWTDSRLVCGYALAARVTHDLQLLHNVIHSAKDTEAWERRYWVVADPD